MIYDIYATEGDLNRLLLIEWRQKAMWSSMLGHYHVGAYVVNGDWPLLPFSHHVLINPHSGELSYFVRHVDSNDFPGFEKAYPAWGWDHDTCPKFMKAYPNKRTSHPGYNELLTIQQPMLFAPQDLVELVA